MRYEFRSGEWDAFYVQVSHTISQTCPLLICYNNVGAWRPLSSLSEPSRANVKEILVRVFYKRDIMCLVHVITVVFADIDKVHHSVRKYVCAFTGWFITLSFSHKSNNKNEYLMDGTVI